MFCRKCGAKILDDSVFCPECGTKVETITTTPVDEPLPETNREADIHLPDEAIDAVNVEVVENDILQKHNVVVPFNAKKSNKILKITICILFIIVLIIVINYFRNEGNHSNESVLSDVNGSGHCEYYTDCSNEKVDGTDYCYSHLCDYSDCTSSKGYSSNYCYSHQCSYSLCYSKAMAGSEYCNTHTCAANGCYNQVEFDSPNCSEHQVNIRNRLSAPSMYFYLNSAGGIKFNFSATNNSGKTIKYVRFKAYLKNAVGDPIQEEISNNYYADVEIIGPINNNGTVSLYSEIIGYCDNLARIDVRDVTIVYTDGTSETGSYNYYCD